MSDQTSESRTPSRRRVPPAWLLLVAGLGFFLTAGIRYAVDSTRSWELTAVAGVLFVIGGLVAAALKRSFR